MVLKNSPGHVREPLIYTYRPILVQIPRVHVDRRDVGYESRTKLRREMRTQKSKHKTGKMLLWFEVESGSTQARNK